MQQFELRARSGRSLSYASMTAARTEQIFKAKVDATDGSSVLESLQGATAAMHNGRMSTLQRIILTATTLTLAGTAAVSLEMTCTHPDGPNHTYSVSGDQGVFTWDDHDIKRTWLLNCNDQRNGLSACHRSESFGERGASVITFVMLPNGILVESGYWALLDTSRVSVTADFVCETEGE